MKELASSTPAILLLVIGSYYIGTLLYRRLRSAWVHPIVVSMILVIATLLLLGIDYPTFKQGAAFLDFLLGPSVVALGYLLYEQMGHLRGREIIILVATLVGGLVGIGSVIALGLLFNLDDALIASLQPKSATMPIALPLSQQWGGIESVTAIVVFFTGLIGSIVGPWILEKCGITNPIARGLALGSASHGIGTSRAIELGALEGAVSGLAIGLTGVTISLLIPLFEWITG
ncbi:MAG: LrgB family protein [Bacteroidaceae bacterium]|nr:LrgB family protein [Bacteroidaceae bacterium]